MTFLAEHWQAILIAWLGTGVYFLMAWHRMISGGKR